MSKMRRSLTFFSARQIKIIKIAAAFMLFSIIFLSGLSLEIPFLPGRFGVWRSLHGFLAYMSSAALMLYIYKSASGTRVLLRLSILLMVFLLLISGYYGAYRFSADIFTGSKTSVRFLHGLLSWLLLSIFLLWLYLARQKKAKR